jgi:ubiquinone biosynthesis protein COQ4
MKKAYNFVKLFWNLFRVSRNPQNTKAAINVADCLYCMGLLQIELDTIKMNNEGAQYIQSRTRLERYNLANLDQKLESTLGNIYARHMISQKLQPDFYDPVPIVDDMSYVMMRMRETHDLWHVITGFDTSVPGELGLQAFMFAQLNTPLAPILICGRSLIATFKNPKEVPEIFDKVAKGWQMGKNALPIFALDWGKNWDKALLTLRQEYRIQV